MIFTETKLAGAYIIELDELGDERGFFARSFDYEEFKVRGLNPQVVQCNISFNKNKGTFRGMHYQAAPHEEEKLVRCTMGAIYDVIIDLRTDSPTFKQWIGNELSAENRKMLYIPKGFAHGFQTLEDDSEVFYQISDFFYEDYARGVRWDDPAFGLKLKLPVSVISDRDQNFPLMGTD